MTPFDWDRNVEIVSRDAQDVGRWQRTSKLGDASIELRSSEDVIHVPHSRAGRWPVVETADWGAVEASVWGFAIVGSRWRGGTFDMLRAGDEDKEMSRGEWGDNYALDSPGLVVARGVPFGLMVSTPARGAKVRSTNERTDVVIVAYGESRVLWREGDGAPTEPPTEPPTDPIAARLATLEAAVAALERWARGYVR